MNKHLSKTITFIIISSTVFVLSFGVCLFIYLEINNTKEKVILLSREVIEKNQKNNELEAIRRNLKATLSDNARLASFFVPHDSVADFIQTAETLGKKSGLIISTKKVESESSVELDQFDKEILSIIMDTEGSWSDTMQFIGLLSNLPYKISISSLVLESLDKSEKKGGAGWQGSINFNVIKIKE